MSTVKISYTTLNDGQVTQFLVVIKTVCWARAVALEAHSIFSPWIGEQTVFVIKLSVFISWESLSNATRKAPSSACPSKCYAEEDILFNFIFYQFILRALNEQLLRPSSPHVSEWQIVSSLPFPAALRSNPPVLEIQRGTVSLESVVLVSQRSCLQISCC